MATPRKRPRSLTEILFTRTELDRDILDARRTEAILIASHIRSKAAEVRGTADFHPEHAYTSLADSIERQDYRDERDA